MHTAQIPQRNKAAHPLSHKAKVQQRHGLLCPSPLQRAALLCLTPALEGSLAHSCCPTASRALGAGVCPF